MQLFNYSFRYLLKKRGNSFSRLLSLTLGMTVALLIFSYVGLNLSYNNCFPGKESVYQVWAQSPQYGMSDKQVKPFAPNLLADVPQLEAAVHLLENTTYITTVDGEEFIIKSLQANNTLFDVLDFGVVSGDPRRILGEEGAAGNEIMISQRFAKMIFGDEDPLGKIVGTSVVAGVFETPPVNQSIGQFDLLEHLPYDKEDEIWFGQDSYMTFIKLRQGTDIAEVEAAMPAFIKKHGLEVYCKEWQATYHFVPLTSTAYIANDVLQMQMLYSAIAIVALLIACLNYVLLTISSLAERSRTIATMKCNGASSATVFGMLLMETLFLLVTSFALSVLTIACLGGEVLEFTGYGLGDLFAVERMWIPAVVCVVCFVVAGIIPAVLFSLVSINYAFHSGGDNRLWWKKTLVFVQVAATVAVVIFLFITDRQGAYIMNSDYGYKFDRLVVARLSTKIKDAEVLSDKLRSLPFVENVGMSGSCPVYGYSGMPCVDEDGNLIFSCRWDVVDHNYIPTMQMDVVQGRNFEADDRAGKAIVNEEYVRRRGWNGNPVGRTIYDSSMKTFEIVGVVRDYRMGTTGESAPIVLHPSSYVSEEAPEFETVVKYNILLTEMTPENVQALDEAVSSIYSGMAIYSREAYSDIIDTTFANVRTMRDGMVVVAVVVLLIALIGLIGYIQGEMMRRSKEIAVRRVCGAKIGEVLAVLGVRLMWIVLPATVCGVALAVWWNKEWLSTLAEMRCDIPLWIYFVGALLVLIVVYAVHLLLSLRAASANPVDTIKKNN